MFLNSHSFELIEDTMMKLSTQEKEFVTRLVEHELEQLKKEVSIIKDYPDVKLLIGEKRYEAFLADLYKKLKAHE